MDPFRDPDAVRALLARIDTAPLRRRTEENTVALVVLNPGNVPATGRVRFSAAYPVRPGSPSATAGVVVRDEAGAIVPSLLASDELREGASGLPPGKVLRSLVLEFAATDVPARGGRAYAAVYGEGPSPALGDLASLPLLDLSVHETDCHDGELPTAFTV